MLVNTYENLGKRGCARAKARLPVFHFLPLVVKAIILHNNIINGTYN